MYLLDTNVISELRKPKPHRGVVAWLQGAEDQQLFISALSVGEIQAGIEITRSQNEAKAVEIEAWLDQVASTFNLLPMGPAEFRRWAQLMHRQSDTLYEDAMIAATALLHGLTVVTRDVGDFRPFGVPVLDPFQQPA